MTIYELKRSHYLLSVVLPAILTAILSVQMLYLIISSQSTTFRLSLLILSVIMFLDYFVALSHPQSIQIDENSISLRCFNRSHVYNFDEVERINVRPTSMNRRLYVRINSAGLFKGRYWIHLDHIENGEKLRDKLNELMEERHPKLKNFNLNSFKKKK